tara:strand:- start:10014 stop:10529 length:516 start_codon:yes stop_codon:yes gene_type:complete
MPNWCNNDATLTFHTEADAQEFFKVVEAYNANDKDNTLFGWFVPVDEDDNNWSRSEKWGTKWDAQLYNWDIQGSTVYLGFDTAWGPPIEVYRAGQDKGINITGYYYEPGMCFTGYFDNGEEEFYEYAHCDSSNVREHIGDNLDDMWGISDMMKEWEEDNDYDSDGGVESFA